jgi:ankyrin repeat protein
MSEKKKKNEKEKEKEKKKITSLIFSFRLRKSKSSSSSSDLAATMLLKAVRTSKLEKFIAKHPDAPLHVVEEGTRATPLLLACANGNVDQVAALLSRDERVVKSVASHRDAHNNTALHVVALLSAPATPPAVALRILKLIESAVSAIDCSIRGAHGRSPLHCAAMVGNHLVLRRLLKHVAASNGDAAALLDAPDADGCSALLLAVRARSMLCMKELVFAGASFHDEAECGRAALHECAARDFANGIYLLHACGVDVVAPLAASGSTPLHLCAMVDAVRAATALHCCGALDNDAATRRRNLAGQSALDLADKCGAKKVAALLRSPPALGAPKAVELKAPAGERANNNDNDEGDSMPAESEQANGGALSRRVPVDLARLPPTVQRIENSRARRLQQRSAEKQPEKVSRSKSVGGQPASKKSDAPAPAAAAAAESEQQICFECKVAIAPGTAFLRALNRIYHVEHLVCAFCGKPFDKGMFLTTGKSVFCSVECHTALKESKRTMAQSKPKASAAASSSSTAATSAASPAGLSSSSRRRERHRSGRRERSGRHSVGGRERSSRKRDEPPRAERGPSDRRKSSADLRNSDSAVVAQHSAQQSAIVQELKSSSSRGGMPKRDERPKRDEAPPSIPQSLRGAPAPPPYAHDFQFETQFWADKMKKTALGEQDLPPEIAAMRAEAKARGTMAKLNATSTAAPAQSAAVEQAPVAAVAAVSKARSPRSFDEYDVAPPGLDDEPAPPVAKPVAVDEPLPVMRMPPQLVQHMKATAAASPTRNARHSSSSSSSSSSGSSSSSASGSEEMEIISNDDADSDDDDELVVRECQTMVFDSSSSTLVIQPSAVEQVVEQPAPARKPSFVTAGGHVGTFALAKKPPL